MKKLMKLRAANDQLLKQIHGLDHNYTETVVQYLRGALSKDPYAVEHAISDLLTTLIDAYQAGHRVSSFFSDDPQTAADNILKELPRASVSYHFAIFWPLIMFLLIESIFLMFISQDRQLTAGNIALAGANVFIMIPISYGRDIFFNKIARKTVLTWLAALVAIFFAPALIDYFSHGLLDLAISRPSLLGFSLVLGAFNLGMALWFRYAALVYLAWTGIWLIAALGLSLPVSQITVIFGIIGIVGAVASSFFRFEPPEV